ncbi:hypothetical protein Ancab_024595 [Ancistrocladus abbreviatus]
MFAAESIGYLVGCPGLVLKEKSELLQIGIGMSSIQLLLVEVPESFMIRKEDEFGMYEITLFRFPLEMRHIEGLVKSGRARKGASVSFFLSNLKLSFALSHHRKPMRDPVFKAMLYESAESEYLSHGKFLSSVEASQSFLLSFSVSGVTRRRKGSTHSAVKDVLSSNDLIQGNESSSMTRPLSLLGPAKEEGMLLMLQLADQLPACAKTSYTIILYSELCIKRKIIRVPEVNAVGAGLPLIPDRALLSVRQRTNLKSPVSGEKR